jgi:sugar-phosphatase
VSFAAAIFDMDGLLIDSEPLWHRAEITVFATVGVYLNADQCRETTGLRIDEVVRYRYGQQPWQGKSLEQIEREVLAEVQRLAVTEGQAMPGVHEVLDAFSASGMPMAIASSSPPDMIAAVVHHLGIAHHFSVLSSAANEAQGKPHPAVYLNAARQLGIAPQRCIAFEDSIPGVQSAHAAGMTVIAVPDAHYYGRPEYAVAALQLRSLAEFDLAAVIRLI